MRISRKRRILKTSILPLVLGVLAGCSLTSTTSTSPSRFVQHFVPPAVKPPAEQPLTLTDPPAVAPTLYARESPLLMAALPGPQAAPSVEVEARLRQADEHFQTGSTLLGKGETVKARAEFDQAVELLLGNSGSPADRQRLSRKYQELVEAIYRIELEAGSQNTTEQEPAYDKSPLEDIAGMTFPLEPGMAGRVKEQIAATQSQLPLELADPVLSYINYFSGSRGKKALRFGMERSGRYAPMIRRILDEEGVPQELIYLAQAESAFLPRAVSRMKATGMWQFVQFRGREYGLLQSPNTDDRLDPEQATRAAARHLRDLYNEFGDWYLAIAAYNCGPVNVEKAVLRTGYADFWEMYKRNVLPRETANYLPIILAMTIMEKNPKDYGLDDVVFDTPLEYDSVQVSAPTHLALLADIAGKPLSEIRDLNPAVLKLVAPGGYQVHVPKGSGPAVLAAMETIPVDRRASWRLHRVASSDTVASIARQYNTSTKSIADANRGPLEPEEGDLLIVPVSYPGPKAPPAKPAIAASKTPVKSAAPASKRAAAKTSPSGKTTTAAKTPVTKTPPPSKGASAKPAVKPVPAKPTPGTFNTASVHRPLSPAR